MQVQHQPSTLRGVFPERIIHKKNFIKENVRKIKQMQDCMQVSGNSEPKIQVIEKPTVAQKSSLGISTSRQKTSVEEPGSERARTGTKQKPGIQKLEIRPSKRQANKPQPIDVVAPVVKQDERLVNRAIQTETSTDLEDIYSNGVLKYATVIPTGAVAKRRTGNKKESGNGDAALREDVTRHSKLLIPSSGEMTKTTDYIKQNMSLAAKKSTKHELADPNKLPATYKRGVVPRYIKQQKKENLASEDTADVECPAGHVLLPEEERKETLRVLRESYAEKIQELNAMPVRSDTLRMQKRKLELEEELKKIDEGIKVFQRPKVFVKINV